MASFKEIVMSDAHAPAAAARPHGSREAAPAIQRQIVNYAFYKIAPEWRRLPEAERKRTREEFLTAVGDGSGPVMVYSYSTVGLRGDADFMLWRIALAVEPIQEMSSRIFKSGLGAHLLTPYSYLAVTKRSMYVKDHDHPGSESSRTHIVPGTSKYLFVYPFIKNREWYATPFEKRQEMMNEHIRAGHRYPKIKINTTYSFGLDDQEFVVAFEGDDPFEFMDLVQELRESAASRYTVRDTPSFTCVRRPLREIVESLG
jgi:chlorite dismutase